MLHDVTLEKEGSNNVRIAEVHAQFDAVIRAVLLGPGDLKGVAHCRVVQGFAVNRKHLKMNLVNVKYVGFLRSILDCPIFDCASALALLEPLSPKPFSVPTEAEQLP